MEKEKEFKLTENGVEEIDPRTPTDLLESIANKREIPKEITPEIKEEPKLPQPKNYYPEKKEIPKEIKQEKIEEFKREINQNPITKNHKLVSKKTMVGIWIFVGILVLLLMINVIWSNSAKSVFNKIIKDKNFADTNNINVQPANVSVPVNNNFNVTIHQNNTIIFPKSLEDLIGKLINKSLNSS